MPQAVLERDPDSFDWPAALIEEFKAAHSNGCVGKTLVSETDRVRVWSLTLAPGERIGFHKHVLDYFWTAVTPGKAISHMQDGSTVDAVYHAGSTTHETFGSGEYKIHDLENVGDTDLVFTTVEFLQSANAPMAVPDAVRASLAGQ